ncbi:MAG: hypothetical protein Q8L71_13090 [Thiobacillus sp.]|nr:hypothetical protein [Thiobacillus sp.]
MHRFDVLRSLGIDRVKMRPVRDEPASKTTERMARGASTSSPGDVRNMAQRRIRRVQFMCASTAASSSAMKVSVSEEKSGMVVIPASV